MNALRKINSELDNERKISAFIAMAAVFLLFRLYESKGVAGGYDSHVYWTGAKSFLHGHDPYATRSFVTPPSGLPFIAPFALLSISHAYTAFQLLATISIVLAIWRLFRHIGWDNPRSVLGGLIIAAAVAPSFTTIGFGSLNGVILLTLVMATCSKEERTVGLWLGLGLALKPVLAPIALILLFQKRWRAALWSTVFTIIGSVIAIASDITFHEFFHEGLKSLVHQLNVDFARFDISLKGLGYHHHWSSHEIDVLRVLAGILTLVAAFVVWKTATASSKWTLAQVQFIEVGSVLLTGTFLVGPFAWRYYLLFFIPLAFVVWDRRKTKPMWLLYIVGIMFFLPDDYGLNYERLSAPSLNNARPTVALVLLLVAMALSTRESSIAA